MDSPTFCWRRGGEYISRRDPTTSSRLTIRLRSGGFRLEQKLIPVTFMGHRHLLALTPNILIETVRPDDMDPEQQPVDRLSYHTANAKGVLMFNAAIANKAHQFAYASRTDEFEQLLKAIQLGRK